MRRFSFFFLLLISSQVSFALPVTAPHIKVDLVSEKAEPTAGEDFWIGAFFELEKDWHVYWKNPGDSGASPKIIIQSPKNLEAGPILWPAPKRLVAPPLVDYGYNDEVLLMTPIHFARGEKTPAALQVKVSWLVCREVCIPGKAIFDFNFPNPAPIPSLFARTRKLIPTQNTDLQALAEVQKDSILLKIKSAGKVHEFFPITPNQIENSAPQSIEVRGQETIVTLKRSDQLSEIPRVISGLVGIDQGSKETFVEISAPVEGQIRETPFIWQALLLALLGGIFLNLMPCVFPVLSIKVLSFVSHTREKKAKLRNHALIYTLGILVSFWILSVILILLRHAGLQIGWGFQLQSPSFVAVMAILLFLMALNFLGVFEIGTSMLGVGDKLTRGEGNVSSFFTGVLATVVATPCSAPFMGSAIGFAVLQPPLVEILIFTFLGLGLALPYVALSFFPGLSHLLPRPGKWMETFKQFLAFPLFATVIWLVEVFGLQTEVRMILYLLISLCFIGFSAWVFKRVAGVRWQLLSLILVLISLVFVFNRPERVVSEKFSNERVRALRASGHPVFLDFTAAWCVSCQVNELVVFSSSEVKRRFAELGVVTVKADWTNYDPEITQTLEKFNRAGVPFYLLYPAALDQDPEVLPEILTPQALLEKLEKFKK